MDPFVHFMKYKKPPAMVTASYTPLFPRQTPNYLIVFITILVT